ncbi:MAG: ribosome biogenesis GTP-binding protein YihA/YsxC [Acutalibacteraceae bacterium]|jgi:GTP-binding protein
MRFDNFDYEASYATSAQLPRLSEPEVAFAGRSNVGKSSLINKLFNRKNLARTSSVPGKTVTINFYKGDGVRFADLPGYGFAKVPHSEKLRWKNLMEGYFNSERNIALVVQLIDIRHKPSVEDYDMLHFLKATGLPFVIALTKSDKLKKTQLQKRLEELKDELAEYEDVDRIVFSIVSGQGVSELKKIISGRLSK